MGEGGLEHAERASRALVERGARAAIVTAGASGAVSHAAGETVRWAPLDVAPLNPVGAGDCLVAGLAWGLASGDDFTASARRGIAMAAASCETFAAGVLERARYEALLASSGH
jgi:fructose-1-phosphate kinase PfkB-like protein